MRPQMSWKRGCIVLLCVCGLVMLRAQAVPTSPESLGNGDGRIHVIPSLSVPSVKNGDPLTISAVITASAGVAKVEAAIVPESTPAAGGGSPASPDPLATLVLAPAADKLGGVNVDGTCGMWQVNWTGKALIEGFYSVILTVTDRSGHTFTDTSLRFSDPIAGSNVVGSTTYSDGGMRLLDDTGLESLLSACVIDTAAGYAYFGTNTSPAKIIKVALGDGNTSPTRVASLTVSAAALVCAVIDPAAGYAYFGTATSPGRVIKIALGNGNNAPCYIGSVSLLNWENNLKSAVIDAAAGYAYFGTGTGGAIAKVALGVGDNPPTRVGGLTFASDTNFVSAVIDPTAGYAYFGTATVPGRVVKVALGSGAESPTHVGSLILQSGEDNLRSAVIDVDTRNAYFGASAGRVVKVALGDGDSLPTRIGASGQVSGEGDFRSAVIDAAAGYAYFGVYTASSPGKVVKVALGSGANPPSRVNALTLDNGEWGLSCAGIDAAKGYVYFGANTAPGRVCKVKLESGISQPERAAMLTLNTGESPLYCSVIDPAAGYAYFGTGTSPGQVLKMALGDGTRPPKKVSSLLLDSGEQPLNCAVIDTTRGYAYFGTGTSPGKVIKVALGSEDTSPTRVAALTLNYSENVLNCAVIDAAAGYAYFGTNNSPGQVVKVVLGEGAAAPTRVGTVVLNSGENALISAVIDPTAGYAYFGTNTAPGSFVKVALGNGATPPTRVGALRVYNLGLDFIRCAVIDPAAGFAYFSAGTRIAKVALGSGATPPTLVGVGYLESYERSPLTAIIDANAGIAFFCTVGNPGRIVKVALGNGATLPVRLGGLDTKYDGRYIPAAAIDTSTGFAYFGTLEFVFKVSLSQKGFAKMTRFTMPEEGAVEKFSFFSHKAQGNVRLGLYREDSDATRTLVWQSPSTSNTVTNNYLHIPVEAGTPSQLILPAGTYHLAWQIDSTADVPSYLPAAAGEGSYVAMPFGDFPAELLKNSASTAWTPTTESWTGYLTYTPYHNGVSSRVWTGYDAMDLPIEAQ